MVTEYVDCAELRRLIEDKKLKPATLKHYLTLVPENLWFYIIPPYGG